MADLAPLRLDALEAETAGDLEMAEQLWWRVIAVSPVDAQAHEAIKRVALKEAAASAAPQSEEATPNLDRAPSPAARGTVQQSRRLAIAVGALAAAGAYLAGSVGDSRILRGGSWSHNPAICRSAYRDVIAPDDPGWQGRIGFRVVCVQHNGAGWAWPSSRDRCGL